MNRKLFEEFLNEGTEFDKEEVVTLDAKVDAMLADCDLTEEQVKMLKEKIMKLCEECIGPKEEACEDEVEESLAALEAMAEEIERELLESKDGEDEDLPDTIDGMKALRAKFMKYVEASKGEKKESYQKRVDELDAKIKEMEEKEEDKEDKEDDSDDVSESYLDSLLDFDNW